MSAVVLAVFLFGASVSADEAAISVADYLFAGQFKDAETAALKQLDQLQANFGPNDSATLAAADKLLTCRIALGETGDVQTVSLARETLQKRLEVLGPTHAETGLSYSTLGTILHWNQDYAEAQALHNQALTILRAQLAADDSRLGQALLIAGNTSRELREYDKAEPLIEEADRVYVAASGPRSLDRAKVLNLQANLYRNQGRNEKALATAQTALNIQLELLPPDDLNLAYTYSHLGHIYGALRRPADGFAAQDRAITIFELHLSPGHALTAFPLTTTAGYLTQIGQLQEAESRLLRARDIRGRVFGEDSQPYSVILVRLGRFYGRIGEFEKAIVCQTQVVEIRRRLQPLGDHTTSIALWSLGISRLQLGDLTGARDDFQEALQVVVDEQQTVSLWQARFRRELGQAEFELGNLAEARKQIEQAWAIVTDFDATSEERDDLLLLDGDVALAEGRLDRARDSYRKAIELATPRSVVGRGAVGDAYERLARLELKDGRPEIAERHLNLALELATTRFGTDHPHLAMLSLVMAEIQAAKGDYPLAMDLALTAEQISRAHFRRMARTMSEARALRYAAIRPAGLSLALTMTDGGIEGKRVATVWGEVAASRAMVLDEISGRYQYRGQLTTEAVAHQAALQTYANLVVRGPLASSPEGYRDDLMKAQDEVERLEKTLAVELGANRPPVVTAAVDIAQLRAALPSQASLLAFVKQADTNGDAESHYYGFLLPPGSSTPHLWRIGPGILVDQLVQQMRSSLAQPATKREAVYRQAGDQLRQLIWDPIADLCVAQGRVFVVPDGTLNLISLGALPVGAKNYLLEARRFHYLTAERDLLREPVAHRPGRGLLALGGVDFERTVQRPEMQIPVDSLPLVVTAVTPTYRSALSTHPSLQDLVFAPLPASRQEVRRVEEIWRQHADGQSTVLNGPAASESRFKQEAAGHSVIHLATHGFAVGSPLTVRGVGYRGVGGFVLEPTVELNTKTGEALPLARLPLARLPLAGLPLAGLALAGANRRAQTQPGHDDGILTTLEIAALDLNGTDLIVLSGCDTGGGTVADGEGVFGLRRAVNMAGAQTLIMSLWPAEDEITRDWMDAMYENHLAAEFSVTESVRLASLDALYRRRTKLQDTHPAFWGCFIATGGRMVVTR